MISRIYEEFNVRIILGDIYKHPTVRDLAKYINRQTTPEVRSHHAYEDQQYYDLSHAQKRIWILQQYQEDLSFFNMSATNVLNGTLDLVALEGAFNDLVSRHEILRSRFRIEKGQPFIHFIDEANFKIVYNENFNGQIEEKIAEVTNYDFDLANEDLIRCELIKTGEDKHVVIVVTHHIISDGWSMHLMFEELIEFYNARLERRAHQLNPLATQFKDYVISEKIFLKSEEFEDHRNYWMNQFYRTSSRIDLRNDFDRPAVRSFSGDRIGHTVPIDVHMHVSELARTLKTTEFTVYLSALYLFVHYWTGTKDITLGSDSAGRNRMDLESQLGVYLNTIALRFQIKSSWTFSMMVKNVHSMLTEAISHESYPFDLLVDELGASSDLSRAPIFDIFVLNQSIDVFNSERQMKAMEVENVSAPLASSKFDLSFIFNTSEETPKLIIEYNDQIYLEKTIKSLHDDYMDLLEQVLQTMGTTIKDIRNPELSDSNDEHERFLKSMNDI